MYYYPTPNNVGGGYQNPPPTSFPLGYGGGYYGGSYGIFNPYAIAERQRAYQEAVQKYIKQQQDMMASLYRTSMTGQNKQPSQEVLDNIYNVQRKQEPIKIEGLTEQENAEAQAIMIREDRDRQSQMQVNDFAQRLLYGYNPYYHQQAIGQNRLANHYEQRAKKMPSDMTLTEYLSGPGIDDYMEAQAHQDKIEQEKLNNLYDNNKYREMINGFNMNAANIDDMTIRIPSARGEIEKAQRRKAFLESILSS